MPASSSVTPLVRYLAISGASSTYALRRRAPSTRDEKDVFVVGGGNSAGQAALHLSEFASHVTLMVRGQSLADSMSEYLIDELVGKQNITIDFGCQIADGGGDTRLEWVDIEDLESGVRHRANAHSVFVLIGAVPATDWLPPEIARDKWGFIVTGAEVMGSGLWGLGRSPLLFETSLPGVFAVGDVRQGSVKRVASAVGEGSAAIQSCHSFLAGDVPATSPSP